MAQREDVGRFPRAENYATPVDLGDPERWGSVDIIEFPLAANFAGAVTKQSQQLVRVQVPQLLARQWIVFGTYDLIVPDPNNSVTLTKVTAEIDAGVGQGTLRLLSQVFPVANVQSPFTLAASTARGTTELGSVPASALAVRFTITITSAGIANAFTVKVQVGASAAPRAL